MPIIALVVGIAVLLFLAVLFVGLHPSPPAITIRHVRSLEHGGGSSLTFEMTNHTDRSCMVRPISVEVRHGSNWEKCFEFPLPSYPIISHTFTSPNGVIHLGRYLGPNPLLGPHEYGSSTLEVRNLPVGSPLRLRVGVSRERPALEGFFKRLDLRFRHRWKRMPLNPFDRSSGVYSKETPIVSDEFIEPQANQ